MHSYCLKLNVRCAFSVENTAVLSEIHAIAEGVSLTVRLRAGMGLDQAIALTVHKLGYEVTFDVLKLVHVAVAETMSRAGMPVPPR